MAIPFAVTAICDREPMAQTQVEFFQEHAVDGVLPPEKMGAMMLLPEGDSTVLDTEQTGKPDAGSEGGDGAKDGAQGEAKEVKDGADGKPPGDGKPAEVDQATLNATNAVITAKDGVHTIPFERLQAARDAEKAAKDAAEAAKLEADRLRQELAAAKAQPQTPAPAASTEGGDGKPEESGEVDFGDYSDEKIKAGVTTLVARAVAPLQAQVEELKGKLGEAQAKEALAAGEQHYAAIYKAHPDADSMVESTELKAWIDKQPSFARTAYADTLEKGSTKDIIELFTTFKTATGKAGAAAEGAGDAKAKPDPEAAAAAAKAALAEAEQKPPSSLSEIPAGANAAHDPAQAMLEKSPTQLLAQFHGKSPTEIMKALDKVL